MVVEANQTTTKAENKTTAVQLSPGTVDGPAIKFEPSADVADRPLMSRTV
jgi:hypothetical protein